MSDKAGVVLVQDAARLTNEMARRLAVHVRDDMDGVISDLDRFGYVIRADPFAFVRQLSDELARLNTLREMLDQMTPHEEP